MKKGIIIIIGILLILVFDNVKAATNKSIWPENIKYAINNPTTWNNGTQGGDDYWSNLFAINGQERYFYKFDTINLDPNADMLYVNVKMKINSVDSYDISLTANTHTCTFNGTYHEYSFPSGNPDIEFEYNSFTCNGHNITGYADLNQHKFNLTLMYFYNENTNLARSCQAIGQSGGIYSFQCPITSNNISGFRITVQTNMLTGFELGFSPFISYTINGTQSAIENQTQEIINQNATYQDTPSKDLTNETQEINNYSQAEENLINSLDFNMTTLDGITINPNTSTYIWQIVERLRQINPSIILLMTSILGMGIIKMVLNR